AHVRALLKRVTGLHGKAIKDLTVRDSNSLFRIDVRHYQTVVARLDGSIVEDISLTLVHLDPINGDQVNGDQVNGDPIGDPINGDQPSSEIEATPLRVPEVVPETVA